jgi:sn-glycerol 3-phosphate transport system permease protein
VKARLSAFAYLVPALAILILFVYFPLARSGLLSFQGSDLFGAPSGFVGFDHYAKLLSDQTFHQVLGITVAFVALTVIPTLVISLGIGLLLQDRIRGVRFFRSGFSMTFAFSAAAASVVFSVLLDPSSGVLNGLLSYVGVDRVPWLTDPSIALFAVAAATVWMQLGYSVLVICAGLGSISEEVLEAARLDGAHGWRLQRLIVIPLLTPQIFFLVITGTIHAMQSFGQIHLLTQGGPVGTTTTLVYSIYLKAFGYASSDYGYASAQAIVLLLVVAAITIFQFRVLERKVHYS